MPGLFHNLLDASCEHGPLQQPKMTLTFSVSISRRASCAKTSGSERPSAMTHSTFRPSRPPSAFDLLQRQDLGVPHRLFADLQRAGQRVQDSDPDRSLDALEPGPAVPRRHGKCTAGAQTDEPATHDQPPWERLMLRGSVTRQESRQELIVAQSSRTSAKKSTGGGSTGFSDSIDAFDLFRLHLPHREHPGATEPSA